MLEVAQVAPPRAITVAALLCGFLAAVVAARYRPGLGLTLTGVTLVGVTVRATRLPGSGSSRGSEGVAGSGEPTPPGEGSSPAGRERGVTDRVALALAGVLCLVPVLRDSAPAVVASVLAVLGLLTAVCLRARTWTALALGPVAAGLLAPVAATVLAPASLLTRRSTPVPDEPTESTEPPGPADAGAGAGAPHRFRPRAWLGGLAAAMASALVVGGLLASADPEFASMLGRFVPQWSATETVVSVLIGGLVAVIALTLVTASGAPSAWDAVWAGLTRTRRSAPAESWAPPLFVTDLLLAAFLLLQAARLFPDLFGDGAPPAGDRTLAGEARQGFGQLVVVTAVIIVQLWWSGRRHGSGTRARRLYLALAGSLVGLGLLLVLSAMSRLVRLSDAYGLTVIRVEGGVVEIWLAAVLAGTGLAVLGPALARPRATALAGLLPRLAVVGAALAVLVTAAAGPDAAVAGAAVDRYERTGRIDVLYLARLSDDAVPALAQLPEPARSCVFAGRVPVSRALWAANVSRIRAAPLIDRYGAADGTGPSVWDPVCRSLDG